MKKSSPSIRDLIETRFWSKSNRKDYTQKTNKNSEKKGIFVVKIMKAMKKIKIQTIMLLLYMMKIKKTIEK